MDHIFIRHVIRGFFCRFGAVQQTDPGPCLFQHRDIVVHVAAGHDLSNGMFNSLHMFSRATPLSIPGFIYSKVP